MKVIPKFQEGGFMSLFTQYTPVQTPTETPQRVSRSSQEKEEKENDKITEKDLLEMVSKIDGLPNDMQQVVSNLQQMFEMQTFGMGSISNLANTYLSNILSLKTAAFNKKEYDSAFTKSSQNGSLDEYALTANGNIIVQDSEGNLQELEVSKYLNNKDNYMPITNSNLLYIRAHFPSYANNNRIFDIVNNGISITDVDKMIRDKIKLGTSETVREAYAVKQQNHLIKGLKVLDDASMINQAGMTLDGLYKNKLITKDSLQQAEYAIDYIYSMLPKNAKTLLQIRGNNAKNPEKGARDLIAKIIMSGLNETYSNTYDYEGSLDAAEKGKSKSSDSDSSSDKAKSSAYYNMINMIGGSYTSITINGGSRGQSTVSGTNYSSIPDINGKPVGPASLRDLLDNGLSGIVIDSNSITFGDRTLNSTDLYNIMYDGQGGTVTVLPVTINAEGKKVVDLNVVQRFEEAKDELKKLGIESLDDPNNQATITQVLYNKHLDGLVDTATGGIDYRQFGQFLIIDGYAVDDTDKNKFSGSQFVRRQDSDDNEIALLKRVLSTNDKKDNYEINTGWLGNNIIYKGSIYIPITNNKLQGITASNMHVSERTALEKETQYQMFQKGLTAKSPSASYIQ